jgi:hypothetical protein
VAKASVTVHIESTPPGASVFVGAEAKARGVTPYDMDVPRSDTPIQVKLVMKGHAPAVKTVDVTQDATIDVALAEQKVQRPHVQTPTEVEGRDDVKNPFAHKGGTP